MMLPAIENRFSVRKYKDGDISGAQMRALLEAAMLAPSACNSRPWRFISITNRDKLAEIANAHPHGKMLNAATAAIIVIATPDVQSGISEGFWPQDCAAATQNILIQAAAMGLGSCWCGIYPKEPILAALRPILDISTNEIPFSVIAIGHIDEDPKKRGFYDEEKVVFWD